MNHPELYLREVINQDLPVFFEHQQDPVAVHMAAFASKDPADREAFTAHWELLLRNDTIIKRSIVSSGEVVGHVASWVQDGDTEITYWIARDHWGTGVATAALRLFLEEVETRPIYGRTAGDNTGSIRVMEKCGFVVIGDDRGYANARGQEIDELVLRLDGNGPVPEVDP